MECFTGPSWYYPVPAVVVTFSLLRQFGSDHWASFHPPPSTGWYGSNLMGRRYIDARRLKCRWKHRDVPRMRRTIAQPIKVIFSRVRNFPRKSNYEIFCHCRSPGNSWYLWKNALFYLLSIPKLYFRSTVVISKEVFMKTFYARDKGLMTFWNSRIQQFL